MPRLSLALPILLAASSVVAQDSIWQANRFSLDLHQVRPCGEVVNRIDLTGNGFNLRSVHEAPDGQLWVVNFITPTLSIMNPDGTNLRNIVAASGNPFQIAFDKGGHAWVSGGSSVEEYDANGVLLNTYPLVASAPLGITVDTDGNKWIAHRLGPPGSVSRIDGVTGVVTNHAMPAASLILPTQVVADVRGIGMSSHIWVVGDNRGSGDLVELDAAGNALNLYPLDPAGAFSGLATDMGPGMTAGDVWVGDFRNGNLLQVDSTNGMVKNTYGTPPNILGLAVGGFGRLWATVRVSFSGPQPSEVRRVDPATGATEVAGIVGLGAGSSASTRHQFAMVVDQLGDLDGDVTPNIFELQQGTSPFDRCSNSFTSINTTGISRIGSTIQIDVRAVAGSNTSIVFAGKSKAQGTGLRFPGVNCTFDLEPTTVFPFTLPAPGSTMVPVSIPNNPILDGLVLQIQGLTIGAGAQFTNVTCVKVWM